MATRQTQTTTPRAGARAHRRRGRVVAAVLAVLGLVLVAVWKIGPRYGFYLVPTDDMRSPGINSPQEYVDDALNTMDQGYYAKGAAWQQARERAKHETANARTNAETIPALRRAIAVAGGKHSHVYDAGQSLEKANPARPMPTVTSDGSVATLTVPEVNTSDPAFAARYAQSLASGIDGTRARNRCGWIVDLRHNHGGDMNPMLAGLTPVLPQGRLLTFVTRTGQGTDLTANGGRIAIGGRTTQSVAVRPANDRPVAVLQDGETGSSGEVVLLSFRGAPKVRTFGAPSAGYATANQTMQLADGTQMLLTTALERDRAGAIHDGPIAPDVATAPGAAESQARAWLTTQCGGH